MNMSGRDLDGPRQCGMTVVELLAALAVVTAAMVALVQVLGLAKRQAQVHQERMVALNEVANEAERLALARWDEVAPDKLTAWEPSSELVAAIAKPTCAVSVVDETAPPARRIELSVSWKNAAGQTVEPVTLNIWKYRSEDRP